jgi:hypothetical protein
MSILTDFNFKWILEFRKGQEIFSSPQRPDQLWGPPRASYTIHTCGFFPGVKAAESWSGPLTVVRAEIKNDVVISPSSTHVFMEGCLIKLRDRFPFYSYLANCVLNNEAHKNSNCVLLLLLLSFLTKWEQWDANSWNSSILNFNKKPPRGLWNTRKIAFMVWNSTAENRNYRIIFGESLVSTETVNQFMGYMEKPCVNQDLLWIVTANI